MNYQQIESLTNISGSLELFKWESYGKLAKCRCYICGDSRKHKTKTRMNFFTKNTDSFVVHCYNCGYSASFQSFLKSNFPDEWKNYNFNRFKHDSSFRINDKSAELDKIVKKTKCTTVVKTDKIVKLLALNINHPAYEYCTNRKIPANKLKYIYYTENLKEFVDSVTEKYLDKKFPKTRGLVFKLYDSNGIIIGFQYRAIDPTDFRYITIMIDEDHSKVYGLDQVDQTKQFFVAEGIFDQMFLENAIAICGGDGANIKEINKSNAVYVLDNEPRHRDTCKRINLLIENGFKVALWEFMDETYKDINDMVKEGGYSIEYINAQLKKSVYNGLTAKLKFTKWKKI